MDRISSIWIIDDDEIFTFGAKRLFSKTIQEPKVESFYNGDLAINELKRTDKLPDLIFLDINMPIMDGWEFLEAFEKLHVKGKIKIIMTSSSIDPEDLKRLDIHHLIDFYLQKPISISSIQEALNSIKDSKF